MAKITANLVKVLKKYDDDVNALGDYELVTQWADALDDKEVGPGMGDFEDLSNAGGVYLRGLAQRLIAKSKKNEVVRDKLRKIIREEIRKMNKVRKL